MPVRKPTVVYRRGENLIAVTIVTVVLVGIALASALFEPAVNEAWRILSIVLAVSIGYLGVFRIARAGVFATEEGITILNPLRSLRFRWEEIESFSLRPWGIVSQVGHAELRDGSSIHIFGIASPNPLFRANDRGAQILLDQLNRRLTDERSRIERSKDS